MDLLPIRRRNLCDNRGMPEPDDEVSFPQHPIAAGLRSNNAPPTRPDKPAPSVELQASIRVGEVGNDECMGLAGDANDDYTDAGDESPPLVALTAIPVVRRRLAAAMRSAVRGNEDHSLLNRMGADGEALDEHIYVNTDLDAEREENTLLL